MKAYHPTTINMHNNHCPLRNYIQASYRWNYWNPEFDKTTKEKIDRYEKKIKALKHSLDLKDKQETK